MDDIEPGINCHVTANGCAHCHDDNIELAKPITNQVLANNGPPNQAMQIVQVLLNSTTVNGLIPPQVLDKVKGIIRN